MQLTLPTTNRQALRSLWQLGAPVTFQALLASTLGLLDTVMVSGVGPAALGGVGLVGRVMFVVMMIVAGLSSGTAVLVAQYSGAGRRHAIRGPVAISALLSVCLTLPMLLIALVAPVWFCSWLSPDAAVVTQAARFLSWGALMGPLGALTMTLAATLRSLGNTRTPMLAGVAALGLNTLLNFLFINGHFGLPAFGVAAAAVATTMARLVELALLWHVCRPGAVWRLVRILRWAHARLVLRSGGPLIFKEIAWAGGVLASTLLISRMGTVPLAAYNLVLPVEGIMISVVAGCGVATGILLGHAIGAGQFLDARDTANRMLRLVSSGALLVGVLMALIVQLVRLSGGLQQAIGPELYQDALNCLSIICLAFGAKSHNTMVSVGILRSGNDGKWLMWADIISMWLINVPLVAFVVLVCQWQLPAVVGVMVMEEVLKVAMFGWRVRSGKWLQRL